MRFRLLLFASVLISAPALAYPEFQVFVEEHSGRNVNCALCHSHPDGPEGLKPGQIGSLSPEELDALSRARAAFEPGSGVHSPILNEFGNAIIDTLGKQEFLRLRQEPEALAAALQADSDLDGDGLSDSQEYLAGTLATDPNHGEPWKLFLINLQRRWFHVLMIGLATLAGLYGLNNFIHGFEALQAEKSRPQE